MSKQENFNDILRSKFTERETPVNEEDWRKMRKTIDDSRNRKKRILWLASSILGLLLGIGIYEYISLNNTPGKIVQSSSKMPQTIVNTSTDDKKTNPANTSITAPAAKTVTSTSTTNVAPDKTISQHSIVSNEPLKKSPAKTGSVSEKVHYVASAKTTKQTPSATGKAILTASYKQNKTDSVGAETSMESVTNNSSPNGDKDASITNQTNAKQAENASPGSATVNKKPDDTQDVVQNETSNNTTNDIPPATLSKKADSIAKSTSPPEETKNPTVPPKKDDTATKVAPEIASSLPPIEGVKPRKNSLSIEAGAGYSLGWSYSDTTEGRGVNPTIGIGYTRILSPKFALKTGIQLSSLCGMGTSPFIIKHVNYDFGYNSNDTTVQTNWLFYLTVPLQFEYKLDEKDAIGLGGTLSYLITGYGQVSTSSLTGDVTHGGNTYSQFMYVKGFNQWNASVFLLYKRTLFGKLSAYIIPYFGLMDIKSNSFFSQNKFERDSGLKLLLSYTIL